LGRSAAGVWVLFDAAGRAGCAALPLAHAGSSRPGGTTVGHCTDRACNTLPPGPQAENEDLQSTTAWLEEQKGKADETNMRCGCRHGSSSTTARQRKT